MRPGSFGILGTVLLSTLMLAPTVLAADSTVVVRPSSPNGWITDTTLLGNPPVPTTFSGPSDANGGAGSIQFGPIGAPNAAKFEMQPPEVNIPVADFGGVQYDFIVVSPVAGNSANHFYLNAYIDSAANGIGTFTNGFYDCRMSFIPESGGGTWTTFAVTPATAPDATGGALCTSSIGSSAAGSEIRFLRFNGGDTSGNDNGLVGAFDLVKITVGGDTTTYDFEPDLAQPASRDDCKGGGWQSLGRADNSTFTNQGDCIQYFNTGK